MKGRSIINQAKIDMEIIQEETLKLGVTCVCGGECIELEVLEDN